MKPLHTVLGLSHGPNEEVLLATHPYMRGVRAVVQIFTNTPNGGGVEATERTWVGDALFDRIHPIHAYARFSLLLNMTPVRGIG